jgi:mRNA-degrading endonuclease toxin of MazEF toxin-antitoxin module
MVTKRAAWVPKRGDMIRVDFDPSAGHEQQGTRPALVLSPEAFNRFGLALACPVTRGGAFARGHAWTVAVVGAGLVTDGVVLCNQVRTIDLQARRAQFIEAVPPELVADVLARVATLIE